MKATAGCLKGKQVSVYTEELIDWLEISSECVCVCVCVGLNTECVTDMNECVWKDQVSL